MASSISEFKLPFFLCLPLEADPGPEDADDLDPAGLERWTSPRVAAAARDGRSDSELELLLPVLVNWVCLTAEVSSMMVVPAAD